MGQKNLESWHKSPYDSMLSCASPVPVLLEQRQENQSQPVGQPSAVVGELMGAKGPSSCVGVGLKNEISLRRPWAEALGGIFLPFLLYY